MKLTILVNRYGFRNEIDEELRIWLYDLLTQLEVDVELFDELDPGELGDYLLTSQVDIVSHPSINAAQIFFKGELIGEWAGEELRMVKGDESGELYYEATIEYWSIFDDDIT